jgi:chromosome segregation ATPase
MTTRREVPFTGDALGWVHSELADIKSKLALAQQGTDQGRAVAADAADRANALRARLEQIETQFPQLVHMQDELRLVREQLARAHDDINSLRQSREEVERRLFAEAERERQDKNDISKHFGDLQRQLDAVAERFGGFEEHNRRNLEAFAQTQLKVEELANDREASEIRHSRSQTTLSRLDQDVSRLSAALPDLQREDDVQKERANSLSEMVRRLEDQIDALRTQLGRVDRIDDRLELVQAERSRHGERLNELTMEMEEARETASELGSRLALLEVRMQSFQDDVRALDEKLHGFRDEFVSYLRAVTDMETDFRKRQIAALEKEARDLRTKGLSLGEE